MSKQIKIVFEHGQDGMDSVILGLSVNYDKLFCVRYYDYCIGVKLTKPEYNLFGVPNGHKNERKKFDIEDEKECINWLLGTDKYKIIKNIPIMYMIVEIEE